jgi:hypothetical protein
MILLRLKKKIQIFSNENIIYIYIYMNIITKKKRKLKGQKDKSMKKHLYPRLSITEHITPPNSRSVSRVHRSAVRIAL